MQASNAVGPQYDFTSQDGDQVAQSGERGVRHGHGATSMRPSPRSLDATSRRAALAQALPTLCPGSLHHAPGAHARAVDRPARGDGARPRVGPEHRSPRRSTSTRLAGACGPSSPAASRPTSGRWRPEIITPFLVANSTYDAKLTAQAQGGRRGEGRARALQHQSRASSRPQAGRVDRRPRYSSGCRCSTCSTRTRTSPSSAAGSCSRS